MRRRVPDLPKHDPSGFVRFYAAYPRKEDRPAAVKAWDDLQPDPGLVEKILDGLERYKLAKAGSEIRHVKHPGPWLNARRWEDQTASLGEKVVPGAPREAESERREWVERLAAASGRKS